MVLIMQSSLGSPKAKPTAENSKLVMSTSTRDLLDVAASANRRGSASAPNLLLLPTLFPANQSCRHRPVTLRRSRAPRPVHRKTGPGAEEERLRLLQKAAAKRAANAEAFGSSKVSRWRDQRVVARLLEVTATVSHGEMTQEELKAELAEKEAQAASVALARIREATASTRSGGAAAAHGSGGAGDASGSGRNGSSSGGDLFSYDEYLLRGSAASGSSELARLKSWPANRAVRDKLMARPPLPETTRMNYSPFNISEGTAKQLMQVETETQVRSKRLAQLERRVRRIEKLEAEDLAPAAAAPPVSSAPTPAAAAAARTAAQAPAPAPAPAARLDVLDPAAAAHDGVIPPPPEPSVLEPWLAGAREQVGQEISRMVSKVTSAQSPGRRNRIRRDG